MSLYLLIQFEKLLMSASQLQPSKRSLYPLLIAFPQPHSGHLPLNPSNSSQKAYKYYFSWVPSAAKQSNTTLFPYSPNKKLKIRFSDLKIQHAAFMESIQSECRFWLGQVDVSQRIIFAASSGSQKRTRSALTVPDKTRSLFPTFPSSILIQTKPLQHTHTHTPSLIIKWERERGKNKKNNEQKIPR